MEPRLRKGPPTTKRKRSIDELGRREQQIVTMRISGKRFKEIAAELGLCEGTVKVYYSAALTRMGMAGETSATICKEFYRRQNNQRLADLARTLSHLMHDEWMGEPARAKLGQIVADLVAEVFP